MHPDSKEFKKFEEFIWRRNHYYRRNEGRKHFSKIIGIGMLWLFFNLYILTIIGETNKIQKEDKKLKEYMENLSKNKDPFPTRPILEYSS